MRSSVRVAAGPGFRLDAVTCVDDHRGWSAAELGDGHRVVLARRGTFLRHAGGRSVVVDPALAYLGLPDEEERFAHPSGGDVCTSLSLSPGLWRTLAGDGPRLVRRTIYVDARLDLAHRRVLAAARTGDAAFALTESLLPLVAAALSQLTDGATDPMTGPTGRDGTGGRAGAAGVVGAAREVIAADDPAADGLLSLAALLEVSPYALSRAFTRELGVSLTHYRNRVRVGRALDRLEGGETRLAELAAELGFADQAHMTRTVRRHTGHTPAALRRLLSPAPEPRDQLDFRPSRAISSPNA
ncbi:DNA-binding transcriptional regulator AraC [Nonomuraea coxensis DSM 45129]|uniref:DNA-binding transcriptional regulator AraC n=1 Tax=Nonomuraea coxensis DSM 45129 TaxID=1122611 RepID=A0ABX8U3S9_9ACTN|nr:AraC family transcriptional regulator [Nonomuraea coxensis]QYC41308.1 DNA-binding transcriptional regulator AraC [Nonomuraea coxensis DSM 45129]